MEKLNTKTQSNFMKREEISIFCRKKGEIEILLYPKSVFAFLGISISSDKKSFICLSFDSKEVIGHGNLLHTP